ncbi:Imm26 family immunity protein [Lysinibacillus sp. NPDC096418]|uniref:Imm26 family immunity protein n=1 Tax=Lysinibacillus sp. NPDC096418 TaxID=3364138 RepID=UPI00380FBFDB
MKINYPFKPKSNKKLIPGQFWAIPLHNGMFACGRVIQVTGEYSAPPTRTFLAGLMDWIESVPPTSEAIAGSKTLIQGVAHINCIYETGLGCMITGYRPLELDSIEPNYFRSQTSYQPEYCKLMKGLEEIRPITKEEWEKCETLGIWGMDYIRVLAESKLLS